MSENAILCFKVSQYSFGVRSCDVIKNARVRDRKCLITEKPCLRAVICDARSVGVLEMNPKSSFRVVE